MVISRKIRTVKAIHSWKSISRRPTGIPKKRWEDAVKKDIQRLKVPNCTGYAKMEGGG